MAHSPTVQSPRSSPLLLAILETQASIQRNIFAEQFSCRLLTLSAAWHGAMHFR
jgi:hypothetical protein